MAPVATTLKVTFAPGVTTCVTGWVVIVGAPKYYYTFFSLDVDFRNHFRVKADIDADMPAAGRNISIYTGLLRESALARTGIPLDNGAIRQLLGQAARWAGERDKLTAQIERVEDVAIEAGALAKTDKRSSIRAADVRRAIEERRHRNSRLEDRSRGIRQFNAESIGNIDHRHSLPYFAVSRQIFKNISDGLGKRCRAAECEE